MLFSHKVKRPLKSLSRVIFNGEELFQKKFVLLATMGYYGHGRASLVMITQNNYSNLFLFKNDYTKFFFTLLLMSSVEPEGHWKPRNKVSSLNPVKHLVGFEPSTLQFLSQSDSKSYY